MITDFLLDLVFFPLASLPASFAIDLSGLMVAIQTINYWVPLGLLGILFVSWLAVTVICAGISVVLQLF